MDAPAHVGKPGNRRVHQIPQRDFVAESAVVDISEKAKANPEAELTLEDLNKWENKYGRIPKRYIKLSNGHDSSDIERPLYTMEFYWNNVTEKSGLLKPSDITDCAVYARPLYARFTSTSTLELIMQFV
jgi:kynurenine formamidase